MIKTELTRVAFFEGKHIRKIIHEGGWWFAVIDIVEVLTGSSIPKRYWSDLKRKLAKEGYSELYDKMALGVLGKYGECPVFIRNPYSRW